MAAQAARIEAPLAENAALKARIAELERRPGLNSANSSKPPSSDGLKKPTRARSLRERSKRRFGGRKGHKGETLRQSANPDKIEDHHPQTFSGCGEPDDSTGFGARQVFDLPEPKPLVLTEHGAHARQCRACGTVTGAEFLEGVSAPVQYGARIAAFVVYLRRCPYPTTRRSATCA